MSNASDERSADFLKISDQFKLGALTTEASHPVTANLSEVAKRDTMAGLDLLFQVDADVLAKYREFAESGRAAEIATTVTRALRNGGRLFFTGCGATGRLSIQLVSIWRDFWRRQPGSTEHGMEARAFSVMAGGDFALIRSVEGFEDFAAFGRKQLADLGVAEPDVVFAITEGGETSFVIGTAWQGVDAGAKVYFVYNNPDDILRTHVQRSREIIEESRIEKINLTTGPMAITGSTRMQATTIQLCVLLTILEMVVREILGRDDSGRVPSEFMDGLTAMRARLRSAEVLGPLARLVELEESVYRAGRKNNYFADRFGIDVLTDTTERSPTFCTPAFRKFDDPGAAESWSFLFLPQETTPEAWRALLKRDPQCVEWSEREVAELAGAGRAERTFETVKKIGCAELMRFRIGRDGLAFRPFREGDLAVAIVSGTDAAPEFFVSEVKRAKSAGAKAAVIRFEDENSRGIVAGEFHFEDCAVAVRVLTPATNLLLDGVTRAGVKMLLNALSTCTMVRLGRVMGNCMIRVVASNLKLIDRATRYVQQLTGLTYESANRLLFEAVEYVEPRMKADQAYPPVVGLAVLRARDRLDWAEAEARLAREG